MNADMGPNTALHELPSRSNVCNVATSVVQLDELTVMTCVASPTVASCCTRSGAGGGGGFGVEGFGVAACVEGVGLGAALRVAAGWADTETTAVDADAGALVRLAGTGLDAAALVVTVALAVGARSDDDVAVSC
jgi:hypothetical protein